ncbi:MAG: hypothetical protein V3581_03260 [Candidatus Cardinium sp.]|uniref:hypothetical protein n=1 Tax=Candidatus Cardinium sp. TP TaxID=2961955 RepID=UPI0021B01C07|nr:hypothetical protein [Candidatus Cardinium sp. TP]MCT4697209.1 hypothetical protein [Candidatus Cardinium sp. TP]
MSQDPNVEIPYRDKAVDDDPCVQPKGGKPDDITVIVVMYGNASDKKFSGSKINTNICFPARKIETAHCVGF